jgi:hypothetical protein
MTRDEADYIVVRYSRHIGGKVAALNEADLAGFDWPGGQMYFEYVSPIGSLVCRAKVFKFRGTVNPRIMFLLEQPCARAKIPVAEHWSFTNLRGGFI